MRAFSSLFSLLALASTGVFSTPTPQCLAEICGEVGFVNSSLNPVDLAAAIASTGTPTRSLPERRVKQLTNAERFARGLPPKKPQLMKGSSLRRSQSSPVPPTTYRGVIRISRASNGETLGYVSRDLFGGVGLHSIVPAVENAAVVTFKFDPTQTLGPASDLTLE
ncbi:hypothetical protein FRC01_011177, partial [Tulasnella sp. 417]